MNFTPTQIQLLLSIPEVRAAAERGAAECEQIIAEWLAAEVDALLGDLGMAA